MIKSLLTVDLHLLLSKGVIIYHERYVPHAEGDKGVPIHPMVVGFSF